MTPMMLTLILGVVLGTLALVGPWLLRGAEPVLMRFPRLAAATITGGVLVWLASVLALGPVLAWVGPGPAVLSGGAAVFCRRCLAAANPFGGAATDSGVPALLLLVLPAVVAAALALSTARALRRRARLSGDAARELLRDARRTVLSGYDVWLVESARPAAMSFPARHGGIVITTGAVEALDPAELVAVLAHEDAHVRQRHHLVSALLAGLADSVRWVPLAVAAHDALPHYLEIAADGQARRRAGTSALVGALLTLGERAQPVSARSGVLHAAGPERIRQLVHPARGSAGAVPTLVFLCYLIVLVSTTVAVQLPYVTAALHGC